MDDGMIVDMFIARDERAIDAVRLQYGARLLSAALRIVSDPADAEECVSDAYFEAWNRIPPHEPRAYLYPFLAKLAKASALNRVKAMGRDKRSAELTELTRELESAIPSPSSTEGEFESRELSRAISDFVRGLPDEKRAVFVLRYWHMYSVKQTANELGFSEGKVKSLLFRAREDLIKYLKKEGYFE